jgi:hypothetical protein
MANPVAWLEDQLNNLGLVLFSPAMFPRLTLESDRG